MKLLFRILRQNVSIWQILTFLLANFVGGVIVLVGIQAYRDADRFLATGDNLLGQEQLVISKPVSGLSAVTSMLGIEPRFSDSEVNALRQHPAIASVGAFVPARCQVKGQISLGALNMATDMFLESVPDEFIDVSMPGTRSQGVRGWTASIDDPVIPIIIPRSYLNLYNYGYAATRGLPQMSEGLVSSFPLRLMLSGNGVSHVYEARILGFSNKLNTILAPQDFITEVNAQMQTQQAKQPSRLILTTQVGQSQSQSLLQFLESEGYIVEGDADALRMQSLVQGVLMALIAIGLLVSALAFYLLVISILLLVERNKERIHNLSLLGYPYSTIARPYLLLVGFTDCIVWLLSALVVSIFYPRVTALLSSLSADYHPVPLTSLYAIVLVLILLFVTLHSLMIVTQVKKH